MSSTSFKFNFSVDSNDTHLQDLPTQAKSDRVIEWLESIEVKPPPDIDLDEIACQAKMFTCGEVEIGHVIAKNALVKIGDSGSGNVIELADKEHSDLVTGKYEGGLKIWECTNDLIEYLVSNPDRIDYTMCKVLDLGCGAGILGIFTFLNGSHVTFQDYNKEVLESVTIPNVLLNIEEENDCVDIDKCKFYSGDWASFNEKLDDSILYDLILTSETIYNPDNYDKIIQLLVQRLTKNGIAYVAAKTHYFGVGGGMRQFQNEIQNSGLLNSEVCWKSSGGVQREILKVTRNDLLILE